MELDGRWLDRVVEREKPDAVCHLAAQISVRRSVEDPVFDARVNILASIGLIEACRLHGVKRFILPSTGGAAYGNAAQFPTPDRVPARPVPPAPTPYRCFWPHPHCCPEL